MLAQEFRKQVKHALEHLHDTATLEVHPLLAQLSETHPGNRLSGAQRLRGILTAGIAALRPPPDLAPLSPEWRSYLALHSRYVQGRSIGDIERELGIGRRQVQRELRKGLDALTALLWQRRISTSAVRTAQPAREPLAQRRASRQVEQHHVLLSTKLAPPRVSAALVVRERLLRQLDAALSHRLTLISAGAGWGKTTLLSAWASRQPYPVAWLSLDELDNDLTHFWVALIAALRTRVSEVGADALAMLQSPERAPLSAILTALLNDLASVAAGAPILLILDDYHLIDDAAIHEAVTFFLEHLPSYLHLVLATRVDPDLLLSRWRVRGELLEIRAADLRFSAAEATSFFVQALGAGLTDDEVRLLSQRSEGWIAGLQLAMLAMRQRADRSAFVQAFSGSHSYLADYVQEEILERQGLEVQRFLL